MKLKLMIMLPTYNERDNLAPLVEKILSLSQDFGVVVVDDNSPDGTGKLAEELKNKYPNRLKVIHRYHKRGRGRAGIAGLKYCAGLSVDFIVEMDADFSHHPKYIPFFLKEIKDYDVVLGSRFIKGGRDSLRSPFRTFISVLSGYVFRAILGIKLRDIGSGYKLYRRQVIENLDFNQFISAGIAVSMESIFRIAQKGYNIKEVPIIFADRRSGKSKLTWKDFLEPVFVSLYLMIKLGRM